MKFVSTTALFAVLAAAVFLTLPVTVQNYTVVEASMRPSVKEGDYVIVQFSHNDGSIDEEGTPREEYRANFTRFIADVRASRGIPILATPMPRRCAYRSPFALRVRRRPH